VASAKARPTSAHAFATLPLNWLGRRISKGVKKKNGAEKPRANPFLKDALFIVFQLVQLLMPMTICSPNVKIKLQFRHRGACNFISRFTILFEMAVNLKIPVCNKITSNTVRYTSR